MGRRTLPQTPAARLHQTPQAAPHSGKLPAAGTALLGKLILEHRAACWVREEKPHRGSNLNLQKRCKKGSQGMARMGLFYLQSQEGFCVKHESKPLEDATSRALEGFGTAPAFEMMETSLQSGSQKQLELRGREKPGATKEFRCHGPLLKGQRRRSGLGSVRGTQKSGIQTPPGERRARRGLGGHTPGIQGAAGPGTHSLFLPKTGMPWGAAAAPPESFPAALPEQTSQLARKQRFLLMGNVRAAEPAVLLPRSPAGILGKHGRSSTGSGFVASGQGSALEFTPGSRHMPSAPAPQPPSRGDRRHRGGRSPGLLLV